MKISIFPNIFEGYWSMYRKVLINRNFDIMSNDIYDDFMIDIHDLMGGLSIKIAIFICIMIWCSFI